MFLTSIHSIAKPSRLLYRTADSLAEAGYLLPGKEAVQSDVVDVLPDRKGFIEEARKVVVHVFQWLEKMDQEVEEGLKDVAQTRITSILIFRGVNPAMAKFEAIQMLKRRNDTGESNEEAV